MTDEELWEQESKAQIGNALFDKIDQVTAVACFVNDELEGESSQTKVLSTIYDVFQSLTGIEFSTTTDIKSNSDADYDPLAQLLFLAVWFGRHTLSAEFAKVMGVEDVYYLHEEFDGTPLSESADGDKEFREILQKYLDTKPTTEEKV